MENNVAEVIGYVLSGSGAVGLTVKYFISERKKRTEREEALMKELTEYKIKDAETTQIIKGMQSEMATMLRIITIHYPEGAELFKDILE